MTVRRGLLFIVPVISLGTLSLANTPSVAAPERFSPPPALLAGYSRAFKLDASLRIHLAIELEPKDRTLDATAAAVANPASPLHHETISEAEFAARYGRSQADVDAVAEVLRKSGASNVYEARNRLVVGGDLTVGEAEAALHTKYDLWARGERSIVAPTMPLTLPVSGIRAVRGAVKAYTPRLAVADAPTLPTDFRSLWYDAARFRQAYDAVDGGGTGMRIALIEDSSDRADPRDFGPFAHGDANPLLPQPQVGSPPLLDASRVSEKLITQPANEQVCGRDDRGQEPTMDVDATLALAPLASIEVRYDEVCIRGGEGVIELQRALDEEPTADVIVFPFAVAPIYGPTADIVGPTPIPYLEATLRGIPIVVPAGDDGAYGIREIGVARPAVVYPCVLAFAICAGGTQLGERAGVFDEGPWNDGTHATGGGISHDPRPAWQQAPMDFSLQHSVTNRMVPDVSADAAGHLFVFWHGYGSGGVGGTSESASIVGAELAAIDATVPKERRLTGPGDLYALATAHPEAFRDVTRENDRNFRDNTLHPRPLPVALGYHGVLPSPPPTIAGCLDVRPRGCDVDKGYDLVTGLGSLRERSAIAALSASR